MNPELARTITNDWQTFRLVSLHKLPGLADLAALPGRGPFIIMQHGSAPGDAKFRSLDFLLTKENTWLPLFAFVKMPVAERRALCMFSAVGDVMQQVVTLTGSVVLDARHVADALNLALPDEAQLVEAIKEAEASAQSIPR